MKKTLFTALTLLVVGAPGTILKSSSAPIVAPRPAAQSYRWEPKARDVLAPYHLQGTRDSRIEVSLAGDLSLLAVNSDAKKPQLCLYHSHDGGDNFSHQVPVSAPGAKVSSHGENSPILAEVAKGPVVLWQQTDATGKDAMMVARSPSWGHSFLAPQRVSDDQAKPYIGYLASDGAENLVAVWLDGRDPENAKSDTASIYGAFSSDGGATWSKNFRVATGVCPCCRPQALFLPAGKIVVAWRKVFPDQIRDMVSAVSSDDGQSWSAPVRLAVDNWRINGCPETGPQLAKVGDVICAAWYSAGDTRRGGSKPGIRLSWSADGTKWGNVKIASGALLDATQPTLCSLSDGRAFLVFRARDARSKNGWDVLQPYFVAVKPDGTVSAPVLVPAAPKDSVSRPVMCADKIGRVWVAWNGDGGLFLLRGRKS